MERELFTVMIFRGGEEIIASNLFHFDIMLSYAFYIFSLIYVTFEVIK